MGRAASVVGWWVGGQGSEHSGPWQVGGRGCEHGSWVHGAEIMAGQQAGG